VDLLESLKHLADMQSEIRADKSWRYLSYESLVVNEGIVMGPSFAKRAERYGEWKQCYANSYAAAEMNGWSYVEGYAASVIPVLHAWCLDEKGTLVETTWDEPADEYVGIVMDTEWVLSVCAETGYWGVLANDWMRQGVLLKHGVNEEMDRWKRTRNG